MSNLPLIDTLCKAKVLAECHDGLGIRCNVCDWASIERTIDDTDAAAVYHWYKFHAVDKVMAFIEVDAIAGIPELVYFKNEYDIDAYVHATDGMAAWSGEGWYKETRETGHCRCGKCAVYAYVRVTRESHGDLNQRQLEILGW